MSRARGGSGGHSMAMILVAIRLYAKVMAGHLANLAGFPGFVRECSYSASICQAEIRVRKHDLFTIITVNGLDIYFSRLTGAIDGIGLSPMSCCTVGEAPQSVDPAAPPADEQTITRS